MVANALVAADMQVIGTAKITINTATTTNFDFGTPDDIDLRSYIAKLKSGGRLLCVITATTAGTTDAISFSVQDAPDSSGSIGTPATAVTDGTLTGGTGNQNVVTAIQIQEGRPWIRVRVTRVGTTDTHVCTAVLLALPQGI